DATATLGREAPPIKDLAPRAGLREDTDGSGDVISAFGAGFRFGIVQANYAYESHPTLGGTSHFGLTLQYSFNPSLIRIEKIDVRGIYSSLYSCYAATPFGSAVVRNLKRQTLPVRMRVKVDGVMDNYAVIDTLRRPNQIQTIPLTGVMSDAMMKRTGDGRANVEIEAEYKSFSATRTDHSRAPCDVYAPGAIDWNAGVDQAAAWVTVQDPVIADFVNAANRAREGMSGELFQRDAIAGAAALVDALATLDVTYVEDPLT